MKILRENNDYRAAVIFSKNKSKVFIIKFDHWVKNKHQCFADIAQTTWATKLGYNHIFIQSKKNDWFQNHTVLDVLNAVANYKKDNLYIATGGSMSGYASIEFNSILSIDFFIATSPQAAISKEYMTSINDNRWKNDISKIKKRRSYLLDGFNKKAKGIVSVDITNHADMSHAISIKQMTDSIILYTNGAYHRSGMILNKEYPVKKIIKHFIEKGYKSFDAIEIQNKIDSGFSNLFMKWCLPRD